MLASDLRCKCHSPGRGMLFSAQAAEFLPLNSQPSSLNAVFRFSHGRLFLTQRRGGKQGVSQRDFPFSSACLLFHLRASALKSSPGLQPEQAPVRLKPQTTLPRRRCKKQPAANFVKFFTKYLLHIKRRTSLHAQFRPSALPAASVCVPRLSQMHRRIAPRMNRTQ